VRHRGGGGVTGRSGILRARPARALPVVRRAGAPSDPRIGGRSPPGCGGDGGALRPRVLGSMVQLLRRLGARRMTRGLAARVRPVAITGAGVVTAVGQDLDAFWAGLVTGVSGISEIEGFPVVDLRVTRGGEIKKLRRDIPDSPSGRAGLLRRASGCRTS